MGNDGGVLVPCANQAICNRITQGFAGTDEALPFEDRFTEFDGYRYLVQFSKEQPDIVTLSLGAPLDLGPQSKAQLLIAGSRPLLDNVFGNAAAVVATEPTFDVTLHVDLRVLAAMPNEQQQACVQNLASIRRIVAAGPLRPRLTALASGSGRSGDVEACEYKRGRFYYIKPHSDSVSVIHPIDMLNSQDAALATAYLQEFEEARRTSSMGTAPSCTYSPTKSPPAELLQLPPGLQQRANSGYITFTFVQRHVQGPQLEHVLWSMMSFPQLVAYHVKAGKAWMHTRMRSRVDQMLLQLDQAQAAPDSIKRTVTGRYFTQDV